MTAAATFRVCECGHGLGTHDVIYDVGGEESLCGGGQGTLADPFCACPGFRQDADLERDAYLQALRDDR